MSETRLGGGLAVRVSVRRLEETDLETRVCWLNRPETYTWMTIDVPMSLADTRQWFARHRLDPGRWDFVFLAEGVAEQALAPQRVAMGGLTSIAAKDRTAELYIFVDPSRHGRGIGRGATKWLTNFAFAALGLHKVYLYTLATNTRAHTLYESLGFVREGVLRKHVFHQGRWVDRAVFGILREEWEAITWRRETVSLECET